MHARQVGRMVRYTLDEQDVAEINRRRQDATDHLAEHRDRADGSQIHVGNEASPGDICAAVIVKVWSEGCANLKVLLDGNDTLWVTSRMRADSAQPGAWCWVQHVE